MGKAEVSLSTTGSTRISGDAGELPLEIGKLFGKLKVPEPSGLPKYRRLEQVILECIRLGHWKPGDRLPAEEVLTELSPFSLGTVQRAMRQLSTDGIIERRHGDGSYVRTGLKAMEDPWHCRFLDVGTNSILPISSHALKREAVGSGPWSRYFEESAKVVRLDRLISVNDEFMVFSRFYFDPDTVTLLADAPLESLNGINFRALISKEARFPITNIDRQITICDFDEETLSLIGSEGGTQGMRLLAVARSGPRISIFYQEFFIPRTDRPLLLPDRHE